MEHIPNRQIVAESYKNREVWSEKDEDVWRMELLRRIRNNLFQKGDLSDNEWTIIGLLFLSVGINIETLLHPNVLNHMRGILLLKD